MNIFVNGDALELDQPLTITDLLAHLNMADKRVAVEINQDIIPRSEHSSYLIQDGDKIEVVQAIGGGTV
jgi:sulfur carrier protein